MAKNNKPGVGPYFGVIKHLLNVGHNNGKLNERQENWRRLANLAETEAEKTSLLKKIADKKI